MARMICHAGAARLGLLLLIITSTVCAGAEPAAGGLFAIQGETGSDPVALLDPSTPPSIAGATAQFIYDAAGPGWVYSYNSAFVLTGSDRPWFVRVMAGPMELQGAPGQRVELGDIEARDAVAPTEWRAVDGMPTWQNQSGNPAMYIELQFRINVRPEHVAGHYVCHVTLQWAMPPVGALPPASGTIPLELHLTVPEMFSASIENNSLTIPTDTRDCGWAYSDGEATLRVAGNCAFDLRIDSGPDLAQTGGAMPTALRIRQTEGAGPAFDLWGDLGGTEHGQADPPWAVSESAGSPWPGSVIGGIGAPGSTAIGISAAAWRGGYSDPHGDYTTSVVITVSLP